MKRRIHIDRKMPDKAKISGYQNFDSLLHKHQSITKKPKYNGIKVLTGIILIAVVSFLVFDSIDAEENAIAPPFNHVDLAGELHFIDPNDASEVRLLSGTVISIEPSSIVFEDGSICNENVCIRVKEYLNPLHFFLSGIPMTYDSAGVEYTFESAGMIEMEAWSASKKVFLAEGKLAHVEMKATDSRSFNVYAFDSADNKWEFQSIDEVKVNDKEPMPSLIITEDDEVIGMYSEGFDTIACLEPEESIEVIQETAVVNWKLNAIEKREKLIAIEKERRGLQQKMLKEFKNKTPQPTLQRMQVRSDSMAAAYLVLKGDEREITRSFVASRFGIWNCDNPILGSYPDHLTVVFDHDGHEITPTSHLFLVDLNRNAIFKYYPGQNTISLDLNNDNVAWFVTKDGKLAIASLDSAAQAYNSSHPIEVEVLAKQAGIERLETLFD